MNRTTNNKNTHRCTVLDGGRDFILLFFSAGKWINDQMLNRVFVVVHGSYFSYKAFTQLIYWKIFYQLKLDFVHNITFNKATFILSYDFTNVFTPDNLMYTESFFGIKQNTALPLMRESSNFRCTYRTSKEREKTCVWNSIVSRTLTFRSHVHKAKIVLSLLPVFRAARPIDYNNKKKTRDNRFWILWTFIVVVHHCFCWWLSASDFHRLAARVNSLLNLNGWDWQWKCWR